MRTRSQSRRKEDEKDARGADVLAVEGTGPQQTMRTGLFNLPEELLRHICSYLPDAVDLVRLSMVSKNGRDIAREYETKDRTPIFTTQAGVEKVWPHLPFPKAYGPHGEQVLSVCTDGGGYLYVGYHDRRVRKIDMGTEEVVWEHEHEHWVTGVHVDGGYVYTGCGDGKARKINEGTGEVVWEHDHSVGELGEYGKMSVHVRGGYLYTGWVDDIEGMEMAMKIDIGTGEVVWECEGWGGTNYMHGDGDHLYMGYSWDPGDSDDEDDHEEDEQWYRATKIDARTQEVVWYCDFGFGEALSTICIHVDGEHLYTGFNGKTRKIDHTTGEVMWECGHGQSVLSVDAGQGYLFTGDYDGMARKIDAETGEVVWECDHHDRGDTMNNVVWCVHVSGGYLYTGCAFGKVKKIQL